MFLYLSPDFSYYREPKTAPTRKPIQHQEAPRIELHKDQKKAEKRSTAMRQPDSISYYKNIKF